MTLNGVDHYLGQHGTPESRAAYDQLVAQWLAHGRRLPQAEPQAAGLSVNQLAEAYLDDAECRLVTRDGKPSSELFLLKSALKPLFELYGLESAEAFAGRKLRLVREAYIAAEYEPGGRAPSARRSKPTCASRAPSTFGQARCLARSAISATSGSARLRRF